MRISISDDDPRLIIHAVRREAARELVLWNGFVSHLPADLTQPGFTVLEEELVDLVVGVLDHERTFWDV
jgi:hypothetical protein